MNMSCSGCTDSDADNQNFGCNGSCTIDDGSCIYLESDNAGWLEDLYQGDNSNLYVPFTYDYGGNYTYEKLDNYFTELYNKHGQQFDGELINTDDLVSRLPSHYTELPWVNTRLYNGHMVKRSQFERFVEVL